MNAWAMRRMWGWNVGIDADSEGGDGDGVQEGGRNTV